MVSQRADYLSIMAAVHYGCHLENKKKLCGFKNSPTMIRINLQCTMNCKGSAVSFFLMMGKSVRMFSKVANDLCIIFILMLVGLYRWTSSNYYTIKKSLEVCATYKKI